MSSSLFSSYVTADVLQETRMKPWYGSVRGYVVFTNIIVSIFMLYDVKSDGLMNCASANGTTEFAPSSAAYANSFCTRQLLPWYERNVGLICLLTSIANYLSYSWWLMIPWIRKSFIVVRECDEIFKTLKGTPADLKEKVKLYFTNLGSPADFQTDEASTLIVTCHRLWCSHKGISRNYLKNIFLIYMTQNLGSVIWLAINVAITNILYHAISQDHDSGCQLDILNFALAQCYVTSNDKLAPFIIFLLTTTSFLFLLASGITVHGYWKARKRLLSTESERSSGTFDEWKWMGLDERDFMRLRHGENCIRLAEIFSEGSTPFSSKTKALMYFFDVIEPFQWQQHSNRFLNFTEKMRHDCILTDSRQNCDNTAVINTLNSMHNDVCEGRKVDEFVKEHAKSFNNRYESANQRLDDDACGCRSFFAIECIHIDVRDRPRHALLHAAFRNLNGSHKHLLAAHLIISSQNAINIRQRENGSCNAFPIDCLNTEGKNERKIFELKLIRKILESYDQRYSYCTGHQREDIEIDENEPLMQA